MIILIKQYLITAISLIQRYWYLGLIIPALISLYLLLQPSVKPYIQMIRLQQQTSQLVFDKIKVLQELERKQYSDNLSAYQKQLSELKTAYEKQLSELQTQKQKTIVVISKQKPSELVNSLQKEFGL